MLTVIILKYHKFIDNEILMFKNAAKAYLYASKVSNSAHQRSTLQWLAADSVYNIIISFTTVVRYKTREYETGIWQKPILLHNIFQQPWPLKCYIHGKRSYKVLFPLGPNLWPQFRLREIWGELGLLACRVACNTQSPDVRLYLFLSHLSIGTCPLHPQISLAWSHYTTVYPFFREEKGSRFDVFREEMFQNLGLQLQFKCICQPMG